MKTLPLITRPSHLRLTNIRAVDGDTIEAHIELPLGILARRRIRLKHFFAPEHRGATPGLAHAAQDALQAACDGHEVHVMTHGMREDRYGRIAAVLVIDGQPVDGNTILGPLNLTLAAHAADVVRARESREKGPRL
jgi:endonuclease YncB( thermonuclease family)